MSETGLSDDVVNNYTKQVKTVLTGEVLPAFSLSMKSLENKKPLPVRAKVLLFMIRVRNIMNF